MTDRRTVDTINDDQLSQLYDELDRARQELQQHAEADSADAAAGSYAGRAEGAEARLAHVRRLHRPVGVVAAAEFGEAPDCAACRRAWPCQTYNAVTTEEHAIAQPGRWLHIAFTSPDETSANTSALAIADHLRAEFDGVSMRITTNAVEAESFIVCTTACDEQHTYDWTCEQFAGIAPEPEPTAEARAGETVTRVTALYEQWVKAGPPPLGVSIARWWDGRLVELNGAIHAPAEEAARTTPDDITGVWTPDPPIGCLTVTAEPDPFGYEERERTGRNAGLTVEAEATDMGSELDDAAATIANHTVEINQLRHTLDEVLRHFVHKGHPGEPCLQTGWISERTVARWRAVLNPPKEQQS